MNFLLSSFYLVFCWFGSGSDFDFGFGTFVEREKNTTKGGTGQKVRQSEEPPTI